MSTRVHPPTLWQFLSVAWNDWAAKMSGVFSVPFIVAGWVLDDKVMKYSSVTLAALAFLAMIYFVWAHERKMVYAVSIERPFFYETFSAVLEDPYHSNLCTITISLVFRNISNRLLKWEVKEASANINGLSTCADPEMGPMGGYIHGNQTTHFQLPQLSGVSLSNMPTFLFIHFDVEYNDEPATTLRGTARDINYHVKTFYPMIQTNTIANSIEWIGERPTQQQDHGMQNSERQAA